MNQNKLQQKRRKRQAKRKQAQASARRAGLALRDKQRKDADILKHRHPHYPAALSQGTQITPDQPDAEAAPLVTGGAR
jgi:predicted Rossmann fold nucleotide-binding protein DprA/Smf involved in DNA uptake